MRRYFCLSVVAAFALNCVAENANTPDMKLLNVSGPVKSVVYSFSYDDASDTADDVDDMNYFVARHVNMLLPGSTVCVEQDSVFCVEYDKDGWFSNNLILEGCVVIPLAKIAGLHEYSGITYTEFGDPLRYRMVRNDDWELVSVNVESNAEYLSYKQDIHWCYNNLFSYPSAYLSHGYFESNWQYTASYSYDINNRLITAVLVIGEGQDLSGLTVAIAEFSAYETDSIGNWTKRHVSVRWHETVDPAINTYEDKSIAQGRTGCCSWTEMRQISYY